MGSQIIGKHQHNLEACWKCKFSGWGPVLGDQKLWQQVSATCLLTSPSESCLPREPSYTHGGNINWYSHHGKQYGGFLKNWKQLPFDPAIPLLGMYPEKNKTWKDTYTPMLTAALFTIAKTRKQPKCSSTEEWIKKMWYIYVYRMEDYSAIKKNELMPFVATWMDLESVIMSEVSQTQKEEYCMTSIICGI